MRLHVDNTLCCCQGCHGRDVPPRHSNTNNATFLCVPRVACHVMWFDAMFLVVV